MDDGKLYQLAFQPGIQRDGTSFASRKWDDGQWIRFQRGLPRKMGGYSQIIDTLPSIARGIYVFPDPPNFRIYIGDQNGIRYQLIDGNGNPIGGLVDRTPVGFVPDPNYDWMFDTLFNSIDDSAQIIAYGGLTLNGIDSNTPQPVYYGDALTDTPLVAIPFTVGNNGISGGIVVLHPYLFLYGSYGEVITTEPNNPLTVQNDARVTGQKIIYGLPTRGGTASPAGLLWSLDSLIRVTFNGGATIFTYDTISAQSSILSNSCVIEYDNIYFWIGTDRFLFYNGTVNVLPNDTNLNFFFDNLNYAQRQKVWVTKVTRFNEIWWFFPKLGSDECNHAIIYNVKENCWYDTEIHRSAGYFNQIFANPIWADAVATGGGTYQLWEHESLNDDGTLSYNQGVVNVNTPIDWSLTSSSIAWCAVGPDGQFVGTDRWVYLFRFEPDMIQTGDITLTVGGRKYARSNDETDNFVFSANQEKIDIFQQRREMTFKFSQENIVDGTFEFGQNLVVMRVGDGRQ